MKITQNQFFGFDNEKAVRSTPGSVYIATDTRKIYIYDNNSLPQLAGASGTGGGPAIVVDTYSLLPTGLPEDSIAFVLEEQGSKWLPGTLGGTYYDAGWYMYRAGIWVASNELVNEELENYGDLIAANTLNINNHKLDTNNPHSVDKTDVGLDQVDNTSDALKPLSIAAVNALAAKADDVHTHTKSQIIDFVETDYATGAEGDLATSAIQPGDNISELVNDEVYLQATDNVSALTNDANYLSVKTLTSYRSDQTTPGVIYSGYLLDSTPIIKKCDNGVITFALAVTDLETDWTNRLLLSYA